MDDNPIDDEELEEICEGLEDGEGLHLIGHRDIAVHKQSVGCHCQPRLIYRNAERCVEVWLHTYLRSVIN